MTSEMLPQVGEIATPELAVVRCAVTWRRSDKKRIADKSSRDKQRAEYRAKEDLRQAVDVLEQKSVAQP